MRVACALYDLTIGWERCLSQKYTHKQTNKHERGKLPNKHGRRTFGADTGHGCCRRPERLAQLCVIPAYRGRQPRRRGCPRAWGESQKCTSKGIGRRGKVLKHRSSLQKSPCPVVICPYLCCSESRKWPSIRSQPSPLTETAGL